MRIKKSTVLLGLLSLLGLNSTILASRTPLEDIGHCYCTAADERFFPLLINLIGSIHKHDFEKLNEILVYDLGLFPHQLEMLALMQKVRVLPIEITHHDILTPFVTHDCGRTVYGWFAWKPVVIKQALEVFPYVLYIDAGTTVLKSLDPLFDHIREHGYFFMSHSHPLYPNITTVTRKFFYDVLPKETADYLLSDAVHAISAGLQGVSRQMLSTYVMPMYNLTYDLDLFKDDGSAELGFGAGRHDQILFSALVSLNKYRVYPNHCGTISIHNTDVPFHITCCCTKDLPVEASIYQSRTDVAHYEKYIHFN